MKKILGYVRDEQGVETLEWIAVGALIVALALAVYPGTLQTALEAVITDISTALTGVLTT
jgi:Flp pilus assembly pilin Flp